MLLNFGTQRTAAAAGAHGLGGAGMHSGSGGPTHAWHCPAAS
jgi:hypothetical protein